MTLWGGRFSSPLSASVAAFTGDMADRRLLEIDIRGSIAHARMLGATGIIEQAESNEVVAALEQMLDKIDEFVFLDSDEDVHAAVERRLGEMVGPVAGKLHTGRSRNDQVVTDLRIFARDTASGLADALDRYVLALAEVAEAHADVPIPTYTHMQQAQRTSLGHHLLAYAWMASRDAARFRAGGKRSSQSPLGAGASAGSSLPIDRGTTADELGFESVMLNTLDAVGSRDFVAELVFCCAQTMVHMSRLSEELVLWASDEFSILALGDQVSTGSSALPHKKNPDVAELVRGRTSLVIGDTVAILSLQKALPLAYNRDLQEDKGILFRSVDTVEASIEIMIELLGSVTFSDKEPSANTLALTLAEQLAGRGVPFREAHHLVGRVVAALENDGRDLSSVTSEELVAQDPAFDGIASIAPQQLPDLTDQLEALRAAIS